MSNILDVFIEKAGGAAKLRQILARTTGSRINPQDIWNWRAYGRLPSKHIKAFWLLNQEYQLGYSIEQLVDARWGNSRLTSRERAVQSIRAIASGECEP